MAKAISAIKKAVRHFIPSKKTIAIGVPTGLAFAKARQKLDKCLDYCDPEYTKKMMISGGLSGHPVIGAGLAKLMGGVYRGICMSSCKVAYYEYKLEILNKEKRKRSLSREEKEKVKILISKNKIKLSKWKSRRLKQIDKVKQRVKKMREEGDTLQARQLYRMMMLANHMSKAY